VLPIVAKIEKPEALENIEAIVDAADAIMVARGDLGVELPPESVPNVQEELVDLARARRKPVIVATQMLESMLDHPARRAPR
jgi:pyruvate kinase